MDPFGFDEKNLESHIVEDTSIDESCDMLLDSTTTHTILQNKNFLDVNNFSHWQSEIW